MTVSGLFFLSLKNNNNQIEYENQFFNLANFCILHVSEKRKTTKRFTDQDYPRFYNGIPFWVVTCFHCCYSVASSVWGNNLFLGRERTRLLARFWNNKSVWLSSKWASTQDSSVSSSLTGNVQRGEKWEGREEGIKERLEDWKEKNKRRQHRQERE